MGGGVAAAYGKMFKSNYKCTVSDAKKNSSCEELNSMLLLLPEHIIIDIFTRLSLTCLLNSVRYVCKSWATIIGSSHFAQAQLTHSKPGFHIQDLNSKTTSYFLDIKDDDLNTHFERIDLGTPPGMGELRCTCDGILLFWDLHKQPFVVNPILKRCLRVPPLPTARIRRGNVIITRVPRSPIFKLFYVRIRVVSSVHWYVFYVLKIGIDNSWKKIARKKVIDEPYYFPHITFPFCIYSGGNDLYWITRRGVIMMDVDKEITVGEYPLPMPPLDRDLFWQFLWMENHLAYIVQKVLNKTFLIYFLDIDSRKWTLYHEIGPLDYVAACGHELPIYFMHIPIWMKGQLIFEIFSSQSVGGNKTIHLGFNVNTRQLIKIEGIPAGVWKILLHTNSLVSLSSAPL